MRERLDILDALEAPDDWSAIQHRRPTRPPEPESGRQRLIAGIVAILVIVGAAALLLQDRGHSQPGTTPTQTAAPSVDVRPPGSEGTLLFPEVDPDAYAQMQAKADDTGRASAYELNPAALTDRFVEVVLGWRDATTELDDSSASEGLALASVGNNDTGQSATVSLVQPVRVGNGGVWAVTSVVSDAASIDVSPGQVVTAGTTIAAHLDLPSGEHAAWGYVIGDYSATPTCFFASGDKPSDVDFEIVPAIEPDRTAGTECGTEQGGYLWIATADYPLDGGCSPLCAADSSPHDIVTIVPILLEIPENETPQGLTTFVDPTGWKIDLPTGWTATRPGGPHTAPVVFSNTSSTVQLFLEPRLTTLLGLAEADSSFPLAMADFSPDVDGGRSLDFQGNAAPWRGTLTVTADADSADVDRMAQVIASIRFPAIRPGTESGSWYSLGSSHFAEGKGTATFLSDTDLGYLVRAPHGTYALGPNIESCGEGESTTWDRDARQILFACPYGPDVRYELDGTPLPTNPPGYQEPLHVYRVIRAWNGSFLVTLAQPLDIDPARYW